MKNLGEQFVWWYGVVEDRSDPLELGRVRVRCYGWHTDNKTDLPTVDLPWAQPIQPITSAAMGDIGTSPTGIVEGTWVVGFFADGEEAQRPIVMGTIAGIPTSLPDTTKGFNDPFGVYPSRIEEPDVNRLARHDTDKPHPLIESKETAKVKNVPVAFTTTKWEEPSYAYNALYPRNHVRQTESGHIIEIDDTASSERIHEYHKSGTFYEIDTVGNRTVRIQGNDYQLILGNGNLYVDGNLNITVAGKLNVKCEEFNLEVNGNVNKKIGGNETKTVNGNVSDTISGNESLTVSGSLSEQVSASYNLAVGGEAKEKYNGVYSVRYEDDYKYYNGKDIYERHNSGVNYSNPTDPIRTANISGETTPTATGPTSVGTFEVDPADAEIGTPSFATVGGSKNIPVAVTTSLAANGAIIITSTGRGLSAPEDGGPSSGAIVPGTLEASNLDQAIVAGPSACTRSNIGIVSSKYESNGNPGAIGYDSTGGYSYGSYQIATKTGTFNRFMTYLNNHYQDYYNQLNVSGGSSAAISGNPTFIDKWKQLSLDKEFAQAQHNFIQATHYDLAVGKIKTITGIDLCDGTHSAGIQDAVWSAAVQHGPTGGARIFQRALEKTGKSADTVTDVELIIENYDERATNNGMKYFGRSTSNVRQSVVRRFQSEKQDALNLA
jgi:hypothetical protein